tara:strand:+ start:189 stop:392 length:204 start_codon:yes stop_codon:yes gene_type:complete
LIYNLKGGEIMNVFGITKKSINFFINMFDRNSIDENGINRFVEVEYSPNDWQWVKKQLKDENLKNVV